MKLDNNRKKNIMKNRKDKDKLYIQAFERMLAEQQRLDANVKLIHKAIYAIFGVVLALLITLILSNLGIIT
jgi:flagellin-like protein